MGRMDQSSTTMEFIPEVRCLSSTFNASELLFCIWWGSRHKNRLDPMTVADALRYADDSESPRMYSEILADKYKKVIREICEAYPEYAGESNNVRNVVNSIVKTLIDSDLPPLEAVTFTFEIDNCTVAYREQLVRGRQSGYWTQTSRTMSLEYMDVNRSRSVELLGGRKAVQVYDAAVETIRNAYKLLKDLGVPEEDIRLQPSAQVHRVYWMTDLRVLLKTLSKRSDWIAQGSLWSPIISGILSTLKYQVDDYLLEMIRLKACAPKVRLSEKDGQYTVSAHNYDIENMDRYTGKDPQPVDPLWLAYKGYSMPEFTDMEFYEYLKSMYINVWPEEYLKVLGWDRDHPEVKGPYDTIQKE